MHIELHTTVAYLGPLSFSSFRILVLLLTVMYFKFLYFSVVVWGLQLFAEILYIFLLSIIFIAGIKRILSHIQVCSSSTSERNSK